MRLRPAAEFACGASAAAAVGAAALVAWFAGGDPLPSTWAARGFLAMAVPGVTGGAWLAMEHGRAGSRFVIALGALFLARLVFAGGLTLAAGISGAAAKAGLLPGLAAGFVPVMAFEMMWFARAAGSRGLGAEARR